MRGDGVLSLWAEVIFIIIYIASHIVVLSMRCCYYYYVLLFQLSFVSFGRSPKCTTNERTFLLIRAFVAMR